MLKQHTHGIRKALPGNGISGFVGSDVSGVSSVQPDGSPNGRTQAINSQPYQPEPLVLRAPPAACTSATRCHERHSDGEPMSTRNVGGVLDMAAQSRWHFTTLTRDQQSMAIRRLAASGQSEHTIARATGLSVEMINRILAEAA